MLEVQIFEIITTNMFSYEVVKISSFEHTHLLYIDFKLAIKASGSKIQHKKIAYVRKNITLLSTGNLSIFSSTDPRSRMELVDRKASTLSISSSYSPTLSQEQEEYRSFINVLYTNLGP